MSDRPTSGKAPQWGEYAPVKEPTPEVTPSVATSAEAPTSAPRAALDYPPPVVDTAPPAPVARPVRAWDRALTIGLLALAVLNVLTWIPGMLDLPGTLATLYKTGGYGTFTSVGLASGVGIAINVINVVLMLIAVALSTRGLRAKRVTFWIPLTAGVLSFVVMFVLFAVVMVSDPAFPAYIDSMSSAGS